MFEIVLVSDFWRTEPFSESISLKIFFGAEISTLKILSISCTKNSSTTSEFMDILSSAQLLEVEFSGSSATTISSSASFVIRFLTKFFSAGIVFNTFFASALLIPLTLANSAILADISDVRIIDLYP